MPESTLDPREVARVRLDNARWEVNHWARVIAEMPAEVTDTAVTFVVTPETHRLLTEAMAAEQAAREAMAALEVAS